MKKIYEFLLEFAELLHQYRKSTNLSRNHY